MTREQLERIKERTAIADRVVAQIEWLQHVDLEAAGRILADRMTGTSILFTELLSHGKQAMADFLSGQLEAIAPNGD